MAVDVVTEILIRRPRAEVAAFAGDPSNAPRWYDNIRSVDWRTAPPMQVGSQIAFVAHFLGRRIAYTYEIREWVAGSLLRMSTADGPFPMETTYPWEDVEGGTRMTLRNRGEPSGFGHLASWIMVPAMRAANRKDLAKLKELLEVDTTVAPNHGA